MPCCGNVFGNSSQYIKTTGDFIAVDASNTAEKLIISDLRIPYKQILKSRVILKAGQTNYLLNHLGLGDNVTFLSVKVLYDKKSVIEEDNYIQWNFIDDYSLHPLSQLLVLTGNSTNRIKQLYLHNPNQKYPVYLDVMVAVIDDQDSFFADTPVQIAISFLDLHYTDLQTWVVNESIAILSNDIVPTPICYLSLENISAIEKSDNVLTIKDAVLGNILLDFVSNNDANQALSIIEWSMNIPGYVIQHTNPVDDIIDPTILFTSLVTLPGSTYSGPYTTDMGDNFEVQIVAASPSITVNKEFIIASLIDSVYDSRLGTSSILPMGITASDLIFLNDSNVSIESTSIPGTYHIYFDISDFADNVINTNKTITLTIL